MSKMNVVIEVQDATAFMVHPVVGRSGKTYGTAVYCPKRGCMALRMDMDEWRDCREDICTARHRFYPFVIDFEEEQECQAHQVAIEGAEPKVKRATAKRPVSAKPVVKKVAAKRVRK